MQLKNFTQKFIIYRQCGRINTSNGITLINFNSLKLDLFHFLVFLLSYFITATKIENTYGQKCTFPSNETNFLLIPQL